MEYKRHEIPPIIWALMCDIGRLKWLNRQKPNVALSLVIDGMMETVERFIQDKKGTS